jgi:hypothetical protein
MSAVGNLSKTPIDALKGFDDHPEDPQHENIKDPPNGYYGIKYVEMSSVMGTTSQRAYTPDLPVIKAYPRAGSGSVTNRPSGTYGAVAAAPGKFRNPGKAARL